MSASGPFCPRAGFNVTLLPWTDDRGWIERIRDAKTGADKLNAVLAWGQAAGGHVSTVNESVRLVLPPDLKKGLALKELERLAGQLKVEVVTGSRA